MSQRRERRLETVVFGALLSLTVGSAGCKEEVPPPPAKAFQVRIDYARHRVPFVQDHCYENAGIWENYSSKELNEPDEDADKFCMVPVDPRNESVLINSITCRVHNASTADHNEISIGENLRFVFTEEQRTISWSFGFGMVLRSSLMANYVHGIGSCVIDGIYVYRREGDDPNAPIQVFGNRYEYRSQFD